MKTERHWRVRELIVVTDETLPAAGGQVVARYNEKHDVLTLTKHGRGRRADVTRAIAAMRGES